MTDVISGMLKRRQLERVEANHAHAMSILDTSKRHIRTAEALAKTDDLAMAFTAAYDGARKSLAAVLAIEGLRVRPVGGAHRNTGVAAAAFVPDEALEEFDWMRQVRNATEYPDSDRPTATRQDVIEAISAASDIIEACMAYVSSRI